MDNQIGEDSPENIRENDEEYNNSMDSSELEREKDGEFMTMLKSNNRKLVDNNRLDEVGYEPPGIASGWADSLDLMGLKEK